MIVPLVMDIALVVGIKILMEYVYVELRLPFGMESAVYLVLLLVIIVFLLWNVVSVQLENIMMELNVLLLTVLPLLLSIYYIADVYVLGINPNYKMMFVFLVYKAKFIIILREIVRTVQLELLQHPTSDYVSAILLIRFSHSKPNLASVPSQLHF